MQHVNEILASLEAQSKFDLGHEETGIDGCETIYTGDPEDTVTPAQLRAILRSGRDEDAEYGRAVNAELVSPGELLLELETQLSILLLEYIDPETRRVGCAMPAFFRPPSSLHERVVQIGSVPGLHIDTICRALSLVTNSYVSASPFWDRYDESAVFLRKEINSFYSFNSDRTGTSRSTDPSKRKLPIQQFITVSESLKEQSSDKLRIAISRWRKSKDPNEDDLADKFIDLRIALESLYLQNFQNDGNRNAEMRFRLALFGAWYLGTDSQERRNIRKKLVDVYDRASGAVHSGEVEDDAENYDLLSTGQDLCRLGILKFLEDGPPANWGDLVLGVEL